MRKQKWLGFMSAVALAATLSVGAAPSYAQARPNDRQDNNRNNNNATNQNNNNNRRDHDRFDDRDRDSFRGWWDQHRTRPPVGFRDRDRLPPNWEGRFRVGAPLDPELRRRARAIPSDLNRNLPPPPAGYRYMVVGGHVVLVDRGYNLRDVFNFTLNF